MIAVIFEEAMRLQKEEREKIRDNDDDDNDVYNEKKKAVNRPKKMKNKWLDSWS